MRPIPTPGNPRSTMVFEHVDGSVCLRYIARYITGLHVQRVTSRNTPWPHSPTSSTDTGLRNLPGGDFDRNHIWDVIVLVALTLVCWTQTLLLVGDLALSRPPTLRCRIWHTAARIARHGRRIHIRLAADWPWATALRDAYHGCGRCPAPAG